MTATAASTPRNLRDVTKMNKMRTPPPIRRNVSLKLTTHDQLRRLAEENNLTSSECVKALIDFYEANAEI